jgi:tagatose 6-phosphate kinase
VNPRSGADTAQVLTVTLNAALDLTYVAPFFEWGEQNRVQTVHSRAGGKGINVARILESLGVHSLVAGFAGGPTGRAIRDSLHAEGLESRMVETGADSRRTVVVVSESDRVMTEFDEPGPTLSHEDWARFLEVFRELVRGRSALALCGSLPRGLPEDAYRTLAELAAAQGARTVLDTSGAALLAGLGGGPVLVKPNAKELIEAAGGDGGVQGLLEGAAEFRRRGAGAVVVSRGAEGLLATTPEGTWRARPPQVSGNPAGAGDTVVAALVAGLLEDQPWPLRLARAAALSAATVAHPVAGGFEAARYSQLLEGTRVERLDE